MKILSIAALFISALCLLFAQCLSASEKIDINEAPLEDLMKIVHIGEVRAKELISLRPFSSLDELTRIRGIGEERIKDIKIQGLAWVADKPPIVAQPHPQPQPPAPIDTELAASAAAVEKAETSNLIPALLALAVAVFSGIIIFFLKKELN